MAWGSRPRRSASFIMKKRKTKEPETIPMKCPVCTECYRYADSLRPHKCHFGGPYPGYRFTEDGR